MNIRWKITEKYSISLHFCINIFKWYAWK